MNFAIIGGDKRQLCLKDLLVNNRQNVSMFGFSDENPAADLQEANYIILPMPVSRNGVAVNAPYSSEVINLYDVIKQAGAVKKVFGGMLPESFCKWLGEKQIPYFDYGRDEYLIILNAVLTAEAAIKIAIESTTSAIFGSDSLVIGNGRIGKILADYLKSLGSRVTVSARKDADFALIKSRGLTPAHTADISKTIHEYDYIFNTVPAIVLGENELKEVKSSAVVIDLASIPGGANKEAVSKFNINYTHALSLPGKMSPEAAAQIIFDTIKANM